MCLAELPRHWVKLANDPKDPSGLRLDVYHLIQFKDTPVTTAYTQGICRETKAGLLMEDLKCL